MHLASAPRLALLEILLTVPLLLTLAATGMAQDWTPAGLAGDTVTCIAFPGDGMMYAGTKSRGIFRSSDRGANWEPSYPTSAEILCLGVNGRKELFAGCSGISSLLHLRDTGAAWERVGSFDGAVNAFASEPSGKLFAGARSIRTSEDHGATWQGMPRFNRATSFVRSLAANEDPVVYTISTVHRDTVTWSTDYSTHWEDVELVKGCRFLALNSLWKVFIGADSGMFRSNDYGWHWTEINAGLTAMQVNCIAVAANDALFVGTEGGGVCRSENSGDRWTSLNAGLSNAVVRCLALDASGTLYAGTAGGGVYRTTSSTTFRAVEDQANRQGCELLGNSPNPFRGSTSIAFRLASRSRVTLRVFDAFGRSVATLVDAELPEGSQTVKWSAGGLPGGVYLYKLQTGTDVRMSKLVIRGR